MNFRKLWCGIVLGAALCSQPVLAAEKTVSDDQLYDTVRRKLANNPDVKGGAIEVEVRDGVVTLRGKVKQQKQKVKAESVTRKIKGVKKVVNELQPEM